MVKINTENISMYTILALLVLIAGVVFYLYWGARYGVWYDIGIYSITIVFVLSGLLGTLLSLMEPTKE